MLISNTHRFVFIHLHKCAGTSIEVALSKTLKWNDVLLGSTREGEYIQKAYEPMFGLYKHSTAARVREVIGADLWDSYYSFSAVRDPYAVAASQYTFSIQHLRAGLRKIALQREAGTPGPVRVPANRWPWNYPGVKALMSLRQGKTRFGEFLRSPHLRDWNGLAAMKPQLCDEHGALLVDDVIRVEEIDRRWPEVCARLGVGAIDLGRANASRTAQADHRALYSDPEDARFVRELFAEDFEFFGYPDRL